MTITCAPCEVALAIGWLLGALTWLAIYLGLQMFTRRGQR